MGSRGRWRAPRAISRTTSAAPTRRSCSSGAPRRSPEARWSARTRLTTSRTRLSTAGASTSRRASWTPRSACTRRAGTKSATSRRSATASTFSSGPAISPPRAPFSGGSSRTSARAGETTRFSSRSRACRSSRFSKGTTARPRRRSARPRSAGQRTRHPAWREILLLEAERLLAAPDPEAALALLARAGEIPDNRSRTEARRLRLVASASRDAGRPSRERPGAFTPDERVLLDAETALASGRAVPDAASAALERLAASGAGAGTAVRRVLEWSGRFPAFFATSAAGPLLRLARRVAARAGLSRAEERFSRLLEHGAPPEPPRVPIAAPPAVVAEDSATRDLFAKAARVARSTISVLLLGESGTGKEIVARELHRLSGRRGPFLAVNVAALPGTLAEAELFGHARGAFTGADRDRRGLVEESSGGTLFPRRDRRPAARPPGQAPARPPGRRGQAAG